ncbi:MAG: thiamine-monophosphate kinase [Pirellulaceae bacterium]|nr:MAG: thiamine-monophosphate kinase [Pirellulaceae bacterium]
MAWAKMRARSLRGEALGIGDDAAVLNNRSEQTIAAVDTLCEGVHFDLAKCTPQQVGRKSVLVNLSDVAAMAAEADAVLLSLCLPQHQETARTETVAAEVYEGVCQACEDFNLALVGGDTNCWEGGLVVSVTVLGHAVDGIVWRRSGAQPGDLIVVTGPLGGSILGKHLEFSPRCDVARALRELHIVHAAMDISDGLGVDLLRMGDASGCGAILEPERVPVSEAAKRLAEQTGKSAWDHAFGDGEDFELILAVSPKDYPQVVEQLGEEQAIVCGEFTSRTGLWMRRQGRLHQLPARGFIHGEAPPRGR